MSLTLLLLALALPAEAPPEPAPAAPAAAAPTATATPAGVVVVLSTSKGDITLELDREKAPITVENFLTYAKAKHYDGTIFHRVKSGFMIQGGGMNVSMIEKPTKAPIKNEHSNGLKNLRGTIAMARTSDPHSATAQFFINVVDNTFLDAGDGYAVFGKVTEGMDVADQISKVPTTSKGAAQWVPNDPITVEKVRVVFDPKAAAEKPAPAKPAPKPAKAPKK